MTLRKTLPETVIGKLKELLAPARGLTASFDPRPSEQLTHTIWHLECTVEVADGTQQEVVDRGLDAIETIAKEFGGCVGDFSFIPPGRYPNPEKPIALFWITVIWESLR